MVKQLNLTLDDDKFEALEKLKGKLTWREFIDEKYKAFL